MGFPITVRLYGTDTEPTSATASKSALDSASSGGSPTVFFWEFQAQAVDAGIVYKDENKTDISGKIKSRRKIRPNFNVTVYPTRYPESATNLQAYYKTTVLGKKYHYFWFNDYNLPDSTASTTLCLAVAVNDLQISPNHEQGTKDLTLILEKMYSE